MLLLTLESSCDETSAAVVRDGKTVLSNIVASQIDIHAEYGGVVPELAARHHLQSCPVVIDQALRKAGVTLEQIDGICVTRGPGLIGALLVGVSAAKALAFACDIPLVGVHHIEGHILAPLLENDIEFPYLALAVSGGHTHLYIVRHIGAYELIGHTLDDAAGEAFDKVAKMCGLSYPGGAQIDQLAAVGDAKMFNFPRPMLQHKGYNFSFSGIKTAVMTQLKKMESPLEADVLAGLAASFQAAVVEVLYKKTLRAAQEYKLKRIVVAGGVACNSGLRQVFTKSGATEVFFPSAKLCADNAAMLAVAGEYYLNQGITSDLDLNACSTWPLEQAGAEMLDLQPETKNIGG
ncbi:MAG: tRNA (adenosine(37)-N6)-threonylcarbamoyltransferase complex transferase subunit TsaD [Desulfuromonadaceae bacterium]|nr:tRNA (adenosine(37)-N6)-threonylcarbamoyltransferase complex transferase subunit TsaD [Desulfuromonas sp.]MDY0213883.1 tRNA (adenosine(37)-N6)-threonylcarbamoyltransferase complex transferase subunit TsaD [Desulfuromonadaceae bacterium]